VAVVESTATVLYAPSVLVKTGWGP